MTSHDPVVHVIDDDDAVRDSLSFLLAAAGRRVKTYDSATAFCAALADSEPGCIVTDIRMPGMTGIELLHHVRGAAVPLPVIVITGHGDIPLAVEAIKSGAADFIEKPFDDDVIISAVDSALAHRGAHSRREAERQALKARLSSLSARERQVLDGLVSGHPNKTIAYDLGISPRTVEVYRANVMSKMQAGSLSELVRMTLLGTDGEQA